MLDNRTDIMEVQSKTHIYELIYSVNVFPASVTRVVMDLQLCLCVRGV